MHQRYHLSKNVSKDVSKKLVVSAFRTVIEMVILGIVTFARMLRKICLQNMGLDSIEDQVLLMYDF